MDKSNHQIKTTCLKQIVKQMLSTLYKMVEYDKYRFELKEKPKYVKKQKTLTAQFVKRKKIIKT